MQASFSVSEEPRQEDTTICSCFLKNKTKVLNEETKVITINPTRSILEVICYLWPRLKVHNFS